MNNFLKEARKLLNLKENLCIVLGNESCDLDSAVSSLCLAYYYYKNKNKIPLPSSSSHDINSLSILPILNVKQEEFPIKTEVIYFFKQNLIDINQLIFKDEVNDDILQKNQLILVDHHVTPYRNSVIAVHDHRPFDENSHLPSNCFKNIKKVGSCATLIAEQILDLNNSKDFIDALILLYGAIVLDTFNFSKEADKATNLDNVVAFKIENCLQPIDESIEEYREKLFNNLIQAKSNVSNLDSYQILLKDMKIISVGENEDERLRIALPGYPILVQDYIKMDNAEKNIQRFAKIHKVSIILLIGMKVNQSYEGNNYEKQNKDNNDVKISSSSSSVPLVQRDLGLINISNENLFNVIEVALRTHNEPNLNLEEYTDCVFLNGKFFRQQNIKATRKQIVPIIKNVLSNFVL